MSAFLIEPDTLSGHNRSKDVTLVFAAILREKGRVRTAMNRAGFSLMAPELAARIETAIFAFSVAKMNALSSLPGNPYGIEIRAFGETIALLATGVESEKPFNAVGNMRKNDLSFVDAIIDWYDVHGTWCNFDILPSAHPAFLWNLASRGYYQYGFYTTLYGSPQTDYVVPETITLRPVRPEERPLFAEMYLESFGVQQRAIIPYLRESVGLLVNLPNTYCFFALQDNSLAAMAALYVHQDIGYLALAATLPAYRNRGCQKALLQARIARAAAEGCTLIVGQAAFASTSQHNMEKVGLRVAYTKALWTKYNPQGMVAPPP